MHVEKKKTLSDSTSELHSWCELLLLECCIYSRHVLLSGSLASSVKRRVFQKSLLSLSLANVSLALTWPPVTVTLENQREPALKALFYRNLSLYLFVYINLISQYCCPKVKTGRSPQKSHRQEQTVL